MYQIYALLGLMCFTWGAAIYASYAGESPPNLFPPTVIERSRSTRRAARMDPPKGLRWTMAVRDCWPSSEAS